MRRLFEGEDKKQANSTPPWMTTYGDMMTLMLCFFVLLYSFSILDNKRFMSVIESLNIAIIGKKTPASDRVMDIKKSRNEDMLKKLKNNKSSITPQKIGLTKKEIREMQALKSELGEMFAKNNLGNSVGLDISERGLVISFGGQVLFDTGKAEIKPESLYILDNVAGLLSDKTNLIRVEGFTDNVPIHTSQFPSNWELSTIRATTILRYLIDKHKFDPQRFSAAGYGEFRAKFPNTDDKGKSMNRRVDIVILYPSLELQEPKSAN